MSDALPDALPEPPSAAPAGRRTTQPRTTQRLTLRRLLDLRPGGDIDAAVEDVRDDVPLHGATVWVLVCSALLASLGLDTSSTAVVIGAMLISPLMTPILGVGMALAVSDRRLFLQSARSLSVATVASLVSSTLYFLTTPLGEATPEILARTRPTLLDVAIAFFGGVAGIVAASRKEKTNVLPGVAIATALMPPLCVAGYGLATRDLSVFAGAFYLFFLNGVFIATATYLVTRGMRATPATYQTEEQHDRVQRRLVLVVLVTAAPALLLLFDALRETRAQQRAETFVQQVLRSEGREVLRWSVTGKQRLLGEGATPELRAVLVGAPLRPSEQDSLGRLLAARGLDGFRLRLHVVGSGAAGLSRAEAEALLAAQTSTRVVPETPPAPKAPPPAPPPAPPLDTAALRREARLVVAALDTLALAPPDTSGAPPPGVRVRFRPGATARDTAALRTFLRARLDVPDVRLEALRPATNAPAATEAASRVP